MKKIWFSALFISCIAAAQTCPELAEAKKGGWVNSADAGGNGTPATAKYKAKIKPILDSFSQIIKNAYPDPVGSQGKWYRSYWLEPFTVKDVPTYQVISNFKGYNCSKLKNPQGEVELMTETATWLYIQANSVWTPGNFETPQFFLSPNENENLYTIPPKQVLRTPQEGYPDRKTIDAKMPETIRSLPHFIFEGNYDTWAKSYITREVLQVVFITPDNKIPYDTVSIGEFLTINENRLKKYIATNEQYDYILDQEKELIKKTQDLRKQYEQKLNDPAFINTANWDASYLAKEKPFESTGYLVCKRSAKYFQAKETHRPSFLTVVWRWQPEMPYSLKMNEAIKNNFDFIALKKIIIK